MRPPGPCGEYRAGSRVFLTISSLSEICEPAFGPHCRTSMNWACASISFINHIEAQAGSILPAVWQVKYYSFALPIQRFPGLDFLNLTLLFFCEGIGDKLWNKCIIFKEKT